MPVEPACEVVLADEFDADAIDPNWLVWEDPGCALAVADGHLQLQVAPSDLEWLSAGIWGGPFALVGGRVRTQVVPFDAPTQVAGVWLSLIDAESCELQLGAHADTVFAKWRTPDVDVDLADVPVDLEQPLWLQIRIDVDDFVWWETSLDGETWMVVHGEANPCSITDEGWVSVFAGDQFAGDPVTRRVERVEVCSPI